MKYELQNCIANGTGTLNEDGSLTYNVTIITKIVDAYEGKFLQTDTVSMTFPSDLTISDCLVYMQKEATQWVADNYPNK